MRYAFFAILSAVCLSALTITSPAANEKTGVDIRSDKNRLIVSENTHVDAGKSYETVVVVAGSLDFAGSADTLVVVNGKANLKAGSEIRDSAVVIAGSINQEEGAILPENGIQSIASEMTSSGWKDLWKHKWAHSWDSSKFSNFLAPFTFIFEVAMLAIAFLLLLAIAFIAPKLTEGPERILREQPWRSFVVGIVAFVGFIPGCVFLAITLVGILLIPFLALFYLIASLAGTLSVMSLVGSSLLGQSTSRWISSLVGFFAFVAASMIPVVGTWLMFALSASGFGATILALIHRRGPLITVRDYVSYQI